MVSFRLSSFTLMVGVLLLTGCAAPGGKSLAPSPTLSSNQTAADQIGAAQPGDVIDMPASNLFGAPTVVVGNDYTAASGRLCRRLRSGDGALLSRIVCQRETGEWYSPRALYSNEPTSFRQSTRVDTTAAGASADTSSIVVVELGEDDLNVQDSKVESLDTTVATEQHTLQAGETLWSFTRRVTGNALNWNAVADVNGIDDSRRLNAGDVLLVPKALVRGGD